MKGVQKVSYRVATPKRVIDPERAVGFIAAAVTTLDFIIRAITTMHPH